MMCKGISPDAILGVVGTLTGVIFGAAINALSNRGRIKIDVTDIEALFQVKVKYEIDGDSIVGEEIAKENQIPDYIKLRFKIKFYNNTNKTGGINNPCCIIKVGKNEYPLKCSFTGLEKFINIEPHKYIEEPIYHLNTVPVNKEAALKLKNGCKIYLIYNINGRKRSIRKLIFKK